MAFTHLHVHTEYSLLDGMIHTKDLIKRCEELGMHNVAITDHGNVYAAIEFMMNVKKHNKEIIKYNKENPYQKRKLFKPILGCELYVAPTERQLRKQLPGRRKYNHLILLCENNIGWENLVRLVSISHLEGFYYKPRVDMESLRKYSEGLICLTACVAGPLQEWILQDQPEKAEETLLELIDIYGKNNLFIELQDHGIDKELQCLPELVRLARKHGVGLVATNDAHFLHEHDHDAHDLLICVGTGHKQQDPNRMHYPTSAYFKSEAEMRELFAAYPDACDNTAIIAERCNTSIMLDSTSSERYPEFDTPDGTPREEYMRNICMEGLIKRYGQQRVKDDSELVARLDMELDVINNLKFSSYFLITADFINWAREHDIPVGPGRGSAAGSIVAYVMGITDIDPIEFNLLFERFLNPERVSPPDIDIDFCQTRRAEVIEYVRQKYGERCVSHIITYGTMGAKSVIKDVARVMDMSYGDSDRIAKLIPSTPGMTLEKSLKDNDDLVNLLASNQEYQQIWNYGTKLEGTIRNVGMHAAGVVIADREIDEYVALTRDDLSNPHGEVVTQCDMSAITDAGLLKMDFLGLKTLTVMKDAERYVRQHTPDFRYEQVPIDDKLTLELLNRGETMGVFQLESGGMVNTCKRYGIENIEDIIALLALYRPGAMQFMDGMIAVKRGLATAEYEHPLLEEVSGLTYGVMIYQEQVQAAAKLLAGYTLGGADLLRRAMGKKDEKKMQEQRVEFVAGCLKANQIPADIANKIFDKIQKFAGYGFNKSHSACYAHISYWTAYLKAHFPVEFLCGLMSNESTNEKIGIFIQDAARMGIEVLGPCVNKSVVKFQPERLRNGKLAVRFGLASVKSMSAESVRTIIEERDKNGPFKDLEDMCYRIPPQSLRRNHLEVLVQCGAFDWMLQSRAQIFSSIEQCISSAASVHQDKVSGQMALFDMTESSSGGHDSITIIPEWSKDQRLEYEKELTGTYFTGHPLDSMRGIVDHERFTRIGSLPDLSPEDIKGKHEMAGMIRGIARKMSKTGKKFAIITLEDFTGSCEALLWGDAYTKSELKEGLLEVGNFARCTVRISFDEKTGGKKVSSGVLDYLNSSRKLIDRQKKHFEITLNTARHTDADIDFIKSTLLNHAGKVPVHIVFRNSLGARVSIELDDRYRVKISDQLEEKLSFYL